MNTQTLLRHKQKVATEGPTLFTVGTQRLNLDYSAISSNALNTVQKLQKAHFKAYLVGGCIRDLLLGKKPKDFDVATDATPDEVRRLFYNSRVIGRRFKIVHVVYGHEIVEVTTFRSNEESLTPKEQKTRMSASSGLLIRDNVYGKDIIGDSERRDFTINALYLDPVKQEIYDYHGGFYDLKEHLIEMIGSPEVRYSEDPVRIIRALRFSAKLDFKITERSYEPIESMAPRLGEISSARMFEEVNKLFLTGHGLKSYRILKENNLFLMLFPAVSKLKDHQEYDNFVEYALSSSDERYLDGRPNMPHFLYAVLLWQIFEQNYYEEMNNAKSYARLRTQNEITNMVLESTIGAQNRVTQIPFAIEDSIKNLWMMELMLSEYEDYDVKDLTSKMVFRAAYDFLCLRSRFDPLLDDAVNFFKPYYQESKRASEKRKEREQGRSRGRKDKKGLKSSRKERKSYAEEGFEDESNLSDKRRKQLEKARAWRIAMHLEV